MVLRIVLRFLNNERLVQRLSESYPMRRAAQIFVSFYFRGQNIVEESGLKHNLTPEKFRSFMRRLSQNFKKELESAKKKQ